MRLFSIVLMTLAAVAVMAPIASAAQLDCLMIDYEDPNTHEKFYITTAPPSPIRTQVEVHAPNVVSGKCVDALLRGAIVVGDYEKIRQAIHDSWPYLTEVDLDSPGGSVLEALKIGRLL